MKSHNMLPIEMAMNSQSIGQIARSGNQSRREFKNVTQARLDPSVGSSYYCSEAKCNGTVMEILPPWKSYPELGPVYRVQMDNGKTRRTASAAFWLKFSEVKL